MNLSSIAQSLVEIAQKAGETILRIYADESRWQVESKQDESPITQADKEANEVIGVGLEGLGFGFPIISEESKSIPYSERKDAPWLWIVDPLDGTKEFIKRNGEFTVNIALLHEGRPVAGVVYAPACPNAFGGMGQTYWAAKGEGAYEVTPDGNKRLHAATFTLQDKGLKVLCSRSHLSPETQVFIDALVEPQAVSVGSSLKWAMIAKGEAHIYPRLGLTSEWDTAAADILLEEAGGFALAEDTGKPLQYNKENILNPYFIAYGNTKL